ncbi:MAG: 2OG-Fe(II) oxygenase [Acidiferrobacterales bacterium]
MGADLPTSRAGSGAVDRCARITADLEQYGWSICPDFLEPAQTSELAMEARKLSESGALHPAAVGRGGKRDVRAETRGDRICWLDPVRVSKVQQSVMDALEALRLAINSVLYLGLFEYEGHFAVYPRGAFYSRHLDQFQDNPQRVMSCILYLNEGWCESDGGQLRLYLDSAADSLHMDINPQGGTLVTFLSDRFYHEVLPATRERLSLTGWFRVRD